MLLIFIALSIFSSIVGSGDNSLSLHLYGIIYILMRNKSRRSILKGLAFIYTERSP